MYAVAKHFNGAFVSLNRFGICKKFHVERTFTTISTVFLVEQIYDDIDI